MINGRFLGRVFREWRKKMDIILVIVVMGVCFTQGYNAYNCEKQNKVFNKRNLPLKDVKEYNHFCGKLIYAFGVIASLTMFFTSGIGGWLGCILLLVESFAMVKYYSKKEITFLVGH